MADEKFLRMSLLGRPAAAKLAAGLDVRPYCRASHHDAIRRVYAEAFNDDPWPETWHEFDGFDPRGVFVATDRSTSNPVGYVVSFRRGDWGYVSVVAVRPPFRRRGIASALLQAAVAYLRSVGVPVVKVDVHVDNLPGIEAYRKAGFRVILQPEGTPQDGPVEPRR